MVIPRQHLDAMLRHCREGFPNEACGLLATSDGEVVEVYALDSVEPSPVFYRIDPQAQLQAMLDMDERGWELGGIFHSHTRTRAYPSATDIGLAHYPDALYVIVSLASQPNPDVRAFRIVDGRVDEEPVEIRD